MGSGYFATSLLFYIFANDYFTLSNIEETTTAEKYEISSEKSVQAQTLDLIRADESYKFATWGSERSTYTWQDRADHVTINSITDNPVLGDERNFVRIRKVNSDDKYSDNVIAEPGAEYEVYVFFHNNADSNFNDNTGKTFAQSIRLKMDHLPATITKGQSAMIKGTISVPNGEPEKVWDTAYIQTNETVSLRYIRGSVRLHTMGALKDKLIDDEALFGKAGGTFLGYNRWGILPGGEKYSGNVTFKIRIDKAGFDMNKTVSKENASNYRQQIDAVPGEILDFKIHIRNTGTTILRNVVAYDILGEGMEYVPGTTKIYNDTYPNGCIEKDNLFKNGFNIGDYAGGQDAVITYKVKLSDNEKIFPRGKKVVVQNNAAAAIDVLTIHCKAQVTVYRKCDNVPIATAK